ncbi:MAG: ParB N-terminal domain-containing protein, partial [Clostridia bacterium]|nr:ParB N-terminal domain-containing protein [Clostridia bacterium]
MNTYQVMPDLTSDEYEELKADIKSRGVMVPIEFDEQGNPLDGHHRLRICEELGITDYPKVIRVGMTEEEKRTHARKLNMARRQLSQEQRRDLIREQLRETPEKSDRQIATALGVSNSTVSSQRKAMIADNQVCESHTSIGADGKEYPRQNKHKTVTIFNPTPAEEK